jgi:hypothetical protein
LAVGVVAHLVPFQDSANVVLSWKVSVKPTVSHADAEAHATPVRIWSRKAPAVLHAPSKALGLACWSIVQLAPFQRSISGWLRSLASDDCIPTATQLFGDAQDTLRS